MTNELTIETPTCSWDYIIGISDKYDINTRLGKFERPFNATNAPKLVAGDIVELHETEVSWGINNLMVATQNNEQFKNFSGVIDSPLACDVDGATVKLVWTSTYWRVFA